MPTIITVTIDSDGEVEASGMTTACGQQRRVIDDALAKVETPSMRCKRLKKTSRS